jgi:phosphate acyltransferase
MPTIAVDAMGGDFAPDQTVAGVARVSVESDISCILIGDRPVVEDLLSRHRHDAGRIRTVHAGAVIGMAEEPKQAIRAKPDCSLVVGTALVAAGEADALVSAGNTGACVLACANGFRAIPGVRRTALASVFPRKVRYDGQDPLGLLLDVGATIRCESADLVQFAIMGSAYAKRISKLDRPRVGLLNMGAEPMKGGAVLRDAFCALDAMPQLEFVGNIEGNDVATGKADVIVCEGLLGNVVLKLVEGIAEVVVDIASFAARESWRWRLGLALLSSGIRQVRDLTDYSNYGGSPILGFDKLFIKAHGRSNAKAIANAVKVAAKAVRDDVAGEIARLVSAAPARREP